jgi:L-aspartate oxidase
MKIVPRLAASSPGWFAEADVVVVGSGIAGLTTAIRARNAGRRVILVTKDVVDAGSTRWAQGGIAAALSPEDSADEHFEDTIVAGAGLCNEAAVRTLVTEGPAAIHGLINLGAQFDLDTSGELALTREGGHNRDRIIHAGGDATGQEVSRALVAAVEKIRDVEVIEHAAVVDLLRDATGAVQGVTLHVIGEGQRDGVGAVLAPAVVLATGGIGQIFSQSTNPRVATGDGIALALRAGALITDAEFVQFHPTVLYTGQQAVGQQQLVSEAVRGEGAILLDSEGHRFMQQLHPLADLAPRDVVAKAIMRRMRAEGSRHVWLDGRMIGDRWPTRFPTIFDALLEHGIDPRTALIPVAPAQHYHSGGVHTDLHGRTTVSGLYACGEVAGTGVHGANRLASNSLLEGLVFAERIAALLARELPERREPVDEISTAGLLSATQRSVIQSTMTEGAGVLRSADSLSITNSVLDSMTLATADVMNTAAWETTNIHAAASAIAFGATLRRETRGSHWREDFPNTDDLRWRVRIATTMDPDGTLQYRTIGVDE